MSVLDPFSHALSIVIAGAHAGVTALGADPSSGTTWVLCIAVVVVTVRVALLPLAIHGVRQAHAAARARPQLQALAERYRGRRDADSLRAYGEERRVVATEHRLSRLGCLPILLQVPIWLALYQLLADVAGGTPVGAMDTGLAASLGTATLLGVPLAARGYLGVGPAHLAVVAGLAGTAALLSYITQRYLVAPNAIADGVPEMVTKVQLLMPAVSAVSLVVAGGVVPAALLVYWVCNSAWTLGQSAIVWRWFPTPGSPASRR